jgi:DNA ligase-1
VLAWRSDGASGRALPFSELQKRLGRKRVTRAMMERVPVAYVVFDVLYAGGELVIDKPQHERAAILDGVFGAARQHTTIAVNAPQADLVFEPAVAADASAGTTGPPVLRAPAANADSPEQLEALFEAALERGNEGLMIKNVNSSYTPGRRGRSWLKLKRELATLDVVVTEVELGHGKRAGILSDYTFAVRDGEHLLNIGKAYSGLTDREIAEMNDWFLAHTLEDQGWRRSVEPKIVIEVAFNAIMRSDRHNSGFALRFPRILRLRPDKPVEEIDTLATVQKIYERQRTNAAVTTQQSALSQDSG